MFVYNLLLYNHNHTCTKHTQSTQNSGTERSLIRWNSCKYQLNFKKRALMVFENSNFVFYSTWLFCQVNKLEIMKNFCNFTIKYYIDSKFVQQNVIIKWKWKKSSLWPIEKIELFYIPKGFILYKGVILIVHIQFWPQSSIMKTPQCKASVYSHDAYLVALLHYYTL